jgi:hypothetical protein
MSWAATANHLFFEDQRAFHRQAQQPGRQPLMSEWSTTCAGGVSSAHTTTLLKVVASKVTELPP